MTERQKLKVLDKLDMGHSLDGFKQISVEDIITDEREFYIASKGVCSRTNYVMKKIDIQMLLESGQEIPRDWLKVMLLAKKNVANYIRKNRQ